MIIQVWLGQHRTRVLPLSLPKERGCAKNLFLVSEWCRIKRHFVEQGETMLYAVLCYNSEDVVGGWSKEEDDAVMARLAKVQEKVAREGRLGPVARLLPTTAATTLRKSNSEPVILDGPFAETKEQLLGFYLVECQSLEEALDFAKDLTEANPGTGSYEIRPVSVFFPGGAAA